ncbi:MAG: hypothetical protein LBL58_18195 [Tannerellaceae bacterium]|jgi:hypothetical protein|nr:hypothetical protein [Tannerellaceae bacterium]
MESSMESSAGRRWRGGISDRFSNISNLTGLLTKHEMEWRVPPSLLMQLTANYNELQTLINKCHTPLVSPIDREWRNTLLKSTVSFCLLRVKAWAYGAFSDDVMTADDIHQLGFLLPGEQGGHHERSKATNAIAEVKVKVINEDFIRVVIDQSAGKNAAQVKHGWPTGVKYALIVIISANDGKTEVCRQLTTRLHNNLQMPVGSHGKQFIIKASFLKHVDDEPLFGAEETFSMPLTTEDLIPNKLSHTEAEKHLLEIERLRLEVERLQAIINKNQ